MFEENGQCSRDSFQKYQYDGVLGVSWPQVRLQVYPLMRVSLGYDADGFHDAPFEPIVWQMFSYRCVYIGLWVCGVPTLPEWRVSVRFKAKKNFVVVAYQLCRKGIRCAATTYGIGVITETMVFINSKVELSSPWPIVPTMSCGIKGSCSIQCSLIIRCDPVIGCRLVSRSIRCGLAFRCGLAI